MPTPTGDGACTIYVAAKISRSSWVLALHCPDAGGKVSLHALKPADTEGAGASGRQRPPEYWRRYKNDAAEMLFLD